MASRKVMSLVLLFAMVVDASAYTFDEVVVDYWAGSGSNETIVVIDWNGTNGPYATEAHAWGYRWDGTAYVSDALAAIDTSGTLDITGGAFISDAYYDQTIVDGDNHTSSGYTGWWWLGDTADGGLTWNGNLGGVDTEVLWNGGIEGLNMDSGAWTSDTLSIPVPEPMTIALLGLGGLLLRRRRA